MLASVLWFAGSLGQTSQLRSINEVTSLSLAILVFPFFLKLVHTFNLFWGTAKP